MARITLLKSTLSQLGGLEKYAIRLSLAFQKKFESVTLLTTGEIPSLPPSFAIHSHSFHSHLSFRKIGEFDRFCQSFLSKHPSDIVFGLDRNSKQTHLRAGNGVHAAYLATRRQEGLIKSASFCLNPLHHRILQMERQAFEDPNIRTFFTNSHMVKKEILTYYKTDPDKIQVVHNGVEWHEMEKPFQETDKNAAAETLGLPHCFHFLFVGNNFERKGLRSLLLALARLPSKDFHLSVVGKDKNQAAFAAFAKQLHLEKQVTFWGPRKDVLSFYQVADALVIPSRYDPFANVTVEALAMGLFVISSSYNGGHEILTQENGIVIPDIADISSFTEILSIAMNRPKTHVSALKIRNSVRHLDFANQLDLIVSATK